MQKNIIPFQKTLFLKQNAACLLHKPRQSKRTSHNNDDSLGVILSRDGVTFCVSTRMAAIHTAERRAAWKLLKLSIVDRVCTAQVFNPIKIMRTCCCYGSWLKSLEISHNMRALGKSKQGRIIPNPLRNGGK